MKIGSSGSGVDSELPALDWRDEGRPVPEWWGPLMRQFADLLRLPPDWDGYGANVIDPQPLVAAYRFSVDFLRINSPAPQVVPLSSGGVQLEWHREDVDLEIEFDVGSPPSAYFCDSAVGEEHECVLPEGTVLVREWIARLECAFARGWSNGTVGGV